MNDQKDIKEDLARLFSSQRLGVLATQDQGAPYASLLAFAASEDLSKLYFSTPKATRKFRNLTRENRVSMLIDNRNNQVSDFHEAMAVTVVGDAFETSGERREAALEFYLERHPYMADFARSSSSALVEIRVEKHILVKRLQEVFELHMEK